MKFSSLCIVVVLSLASRADAQTLMPTSSSSRAPTLAALVPPRNPRPSILPPVRTAPFAAATGFITAGTVLLIPSAPLIVPVFRTRCYGGGVPRTARHVAATGVALGASLLTAGIAWAVRASRRFTQRGRSRRRQRAGLFGFLGTLFIGGPMAALATVDLVLCGSS